MGTWEQTSHGQEMEQNPLGVAISLAENRCLVQNWRMGMDTS